ncbi:phosphatase PAP2 family protein [Brachybacterium sp. AOP35-5H-19]|uniref:phosphatase PAP2 family protein n=1 Tax=Brachybacterium sp. AOP35-5H-19 TaxID=3457685 RepID=UPI003FBA03C0
MRESVLPCLRWWVAGLLLIAGSWLLLEPSAHLYLVVARSELAVPDRLAGALIVALALVLVVATFNGGPWRSWREVTGVVAGVGATVAYLSSEVIKVLLAQDRPCRSILPDPACPDVGDWSFPSNHATIAFALATAIVLAVRRWWSWSAYLVALSAAAARVIDGFHYPHDVLAGAALGTCVTMATTALLRRAPDPQRSWPADVDVSGPEACHRGR